MKCIRLYVTKPILSLITDKYTGKSKYLLINTVDVVFCVFFDFRILSILITVLKPVMEKVDKLIRWNTRNLTPVGKNIYLKT